MDGLDVNCFDIALSTLFGVNVLDRMQSIQNLGLALMSTINGILVDNCGYISYELMNVAFLCR